MEDCVWMSGDGLTLLFPLSGKPAVDPAAVKLWTLSANDMNDEEVVSITECPVYNHTLNSYT